MSQDKPSNEERSDLHGMLRCKESQTYKKALSKAWVRLAEEIDSVLLLDIIMEKELFGHTAIQDLRDEYKTYDRNRAVLKKVSTSGPEKYKMFKECLTLINQEYLVKILEEYETEIAAQDEIEAASVTPEMGVLSDPELLARCPTQQEIVRMSGKIGKEFSRLGIMLGLSDVDLDHVARENPKNAVGEIIAMLKLWLTKQGSQATIGTLKKAMEDAGIDSETVLAQSLET